MQQSPATVAALLLLVAAASLIALAAIAVRPAPRGPAVITQAAPGPQPRTRPQKEKPAVPPPPQQPQTVVRDIEVAREGAVVLLAHELVTEDRSSCGPVRRIFAVRWRLVRAGSGWRAASLTGVKRSGPEPAEACPARHDAARAAGGV